MSLNLLRYYLRRETPLVLLYGALLFALSFWFVYMYPLFGGQQELVAFLRRMPKPLKAFVGGEYAEMVSLNGVAAFACIHPLVMLIFSMFLFGFPSKVITLQVERGTFDFLLTRPLSRTSFYVTSLAFFVVVVALLAVCAWLGTATGGRVVKVEGEQLRLGRFALAQLNGYALALAVGGLAFCFAAALSSRGAALGLPLGIVAALYFIHFVSAWWEPAANWGPVSIFYYYQPQRVILAYASPVRNTAILLAFSAVLYALGGVIFARRDIRAV